MKEFDEYSDDDSHVEERNTKIKDHEERFLTPEERDKIISDYIAESEKNTLVKTPEEFEEELLSTFENKELVKKLVDEYCENPSSSVFYQKKETKPTKSVHSTFDQIDTMEVHRLYYGENFSQRKVADTLGVPRWVIDGIFKKQGWKARPIGGVEKEIDPQEVYRICIEEGRPKKDAAEMLGCGSIGPINRVLKDNDWKTPLEVKMETEIDPDEVHRLHYDEGWSLKRIANHYGYESKHIMQKFFKEREWIPIGLARQVDRVFDFPLETEREHCIDSFIVSNIFRPLEKNEDITPSDIARCIHNAISLTLSPVEWMDLSSESGFNPRIIDSLENNISDIEASLDKLMGISEDSETKIRLGFVDGKLYIREQDLSEYNWLNIYDNELFYFKSIEEKFRLVYEMRTRLGLSTNKGLGELIDQLTDRGDATGSGYSDIKETIDEHVRAETLHMILDTTGKSLQDIQGKIHCIGKIRSGAYEGKGGIRNPKFPTDPETIDVMFSKFFGLGLSDGHIGKHGSEFVYTEKNPDRREIVIEHSKDFGDVHYHTRSIVNEVHQIQFGSAFGRALEKRGFPVGDKSVLNNGLPEFIMQGSPEVVFTYFRNLWPEDGCFTIEYHRNIGYFIWDRSVVVKDPAKESEYDFKSMVTDDHLSLFEKYGTRIEEDIKNGFKEEIYLTPTILEELTKSKNFNVSSLAKELKEIVLSNQSQLLNDEIETLGRAGVHANQRLLKLTYHIESSRVSISRRGKIYRKRDVMRTALQMLPDDIRKSAKVGEWMNFWPELRREVERELADLDNNHGNNGETH
ncbi:MAG: hypothetical protein ACTSSE_16895 [Candidatus Thorarchaeota archaeon]